MTQLRGDTRVSPLVTAFTLGAFLKPQPKFFGWVSQMATDSYSDRTLAVIAPRIERGPWNLEKHGHLLHCE